MSDDELAPSYIDAISRQLNTLPGKFQTIYLGGGTPTVLNPCLLRDLVRTLRKYTAKGAEFTVESNPDSIDKERLDLFLDNGVNRISIGIQSFNDDKLRMLGRIHDGTSAKRAVMAAYKRGFKNISIDLISGVLRETFKDWQEDLKTAVDLPIKHLSCYSLECRHLQGKEEDAVSMYEYTADFLPKEGFKQYEISNFALNGYCCRHNLAYWNNEPYIGLGPSAVSYISGTRVENISNVKEYISGVMSRRSVTTSSEKLNGIDSAKETAAVKIRTMEGIDLKWFKRKTGLEFENLEKKTLPDLIEKGLIEYVPEKTVRLTHKGALFCDIVSSAFL